VQADVGSQCVDCYRQGRPTAATRARYWSASKPALITYTLIAVNVAVFAWTTLSDADRRPNTPSAESRIGLFEGFEGFAGVADGEWYRLVTSGFLHFSLFHLAFNMLLLYQLGNLLEPVVGRVRFTLLYFAALLGGSAGALLLSPNALTGGASGAVFGLLGASAVALHRRGVNPLATGIGVTIMLNLMITFTLPNISIGGHIGGLIAGGAAGWFMTAPRYRRVPVAVTYAAPVITAIVAVVICVAVVQTG
jgi:membrane associated rhomboid family serine protease